MLQRLQQLKERGVDDNQKLSDTEGQWDERRLVMYLENKKPLELLMLLFYIIGGMPPRVQTICLKDLEQGAVKTKFYVMDGRHSVIVSTINASIENGVLARRTISSQSCILHTFIEKTA